MSQVGRPLFEVIVLGARDVAGAQEGGADRLEVVRDMASDGLMPELSVVRELRRETDLPLRVMLRANEGFSTTGSELARLKGAALEFLGAGVDGFVLGFVNQDLGIDVDATMALVESLHGRPWTFHRAIDHTLDHDRAWVALRDLPGLSAVLTAGSARGMNAGLDDLCRRAASDARIAELVLAGGGLRPEHVPWLARAGVRAFHVGSSVRPGGSFKAYVDASHVRAWRTLIDDSVAASL